MKNALFRVSLSQRPKGTSNFLRPPRRVVFPNLTSQTKNSFCLESTLPRRWFGFHNLICLFWILYTPAGCRKHKLNADTVDAVCRKINYQPNNNLFVMATDPGRRLTSRNKAAGKNDNLDCDTLYRSCLSDYIMFWVLHVVPVLGSCV